MKINHKSFLISFTVLLSLAFQPFSKAQETQSAFTVKLESHLKIEVNLPRLSLDLYKDGSLHKEYPIAIGQAQYKTPTGEFSIKRIEWNPTWYPPDSAWAKNSKVTPPGPKNPLGPVKMVINGDLRIHGTNKPGSVGHPASHGCIRMHNEDAKELAWMIQSNNSDKTDEALQDKYSKNRSSTFVVGLNVEVPVNFIYDPVLVKEDKIEIYPDYYGKLKKLKDSILEKLIFSKIDISKIDEEKLEKLKKPSKEKLEIRIEDLYSPDHSSSSSSTVVSEYKW
ncbi:MAG: L,D-transpeptidase [Deltaproteobacteria bacterium]|nr:L,D-transpeptidase [Deltaproteobacteria bacterium]